MLVGAASLAAAAGLLWAWLNPDRLAQTRAVHLLALLGLFVLPSVTIAFDTLDRRRRARVAPVELNARPDAPSRRRVRRRRHAPALKHAPKGAPSPVHAHQHRRRARVRGGPPQTL